MDAAVCERAGNVDRPHAAGRVALNGDRASGDTATQGGVRQQHVPSRTHAQGMPVRLRHFLSTAILTLHALVCVFEIARARGDTNVIFRYTVPVSSLL